MASTGETWRLGRRPALDGLRGVAVLLVVACHAEVPGMASAGAVGVTIFFTLSGFLITALLLERGMRGFYIRRARRLLPALLVMLAVTWPLMVAAGERPRLLPVLAYFSNWSMAAGGDFGSWGHTWSLSVEEQFYLVWPLALLFLARFGRRGILMACGIGAAWSLILRPLLWHEGLGLTRGYYGTDLHLDALLIGAGLAVVISSRSEGAGRPRLALAGLAALVAVAFLGDGPAGWVGAVSAAPALTAVVIVASAQRARFGALCGPVLGWLGRRSYGLYLWHYPLLVIFPDAPAVLVLMLAACIAEVSYRCVERPFLMQSGTARKSRGSHPFPTRMGPLRRAPHPIPGKTHCPANTGSRMLWSSQT